MHTQYTYFFPIGSITVAATQDAVTHVCFGKSCFDFPVRKTPLISRCAQELEEYFSKKRTRFDLPLLPEGTDFQQKVWQALQKIPYGQTRSYRDIAAAIGSPRAYRAVGRANHANPIAVLIPCHRVIAQTGALCGYAAGADIKKQVLELEHV